MAKHMLIDASHPEETRVVVLAGKRLEEFDYESASKKQLKGNIYLAKITRVEPSLQAAFVEYGGNRHGFLPFSEIHPDYYRIPVADRRALIAEEARLKSDAAEDEFTDEDGTQVNGRDVDLAAEAEEGAAAENAADQPRASEAKDEVEEVAGETSVDTVGGDEVDDAARRRARLLRKYKIQEVIKRRQVILVQVTKEERGNKGAALTSYLSLAGRYCVLMPNTGKGGGISRKISNTTDRRRLKRILENLEIPEGVAVIVRTAGSERTKAEIRRDYEYLLRLWGEIRDTTLASTASCLIYEEANLIKRAMRDLYQSDMDEILVDGEAGYKHAKSFMKSLMPSHAKKVQYYVDPTIPLFYRYQVEGQIDAMHNATVQLKSGGYIVINMTEALVAIDVNSGKATRERHIEGTAYKTNLEAAEEVARQLRLRDLAGLIVIDFIDMEEARHNRGVERKLKEAMRLDRARIQLGRISPFGLLEMSRQRLRPSLFESSTVVCPNCHASGFVRTTESVALHILRALEEEGIQRGAGELLVSAPSAAGLHLLNRMRDRIVEIERRYGFRVQVQTDDALIPPDYTLERLSRAAPADVEEERGEAVEAEKAEKAERWRTRGRRRRKKTDEQAEVEAPEAATREAATGEAAETTEARAAEAAEDGAEEQPKRRRRRGKRGGRGRSRRPPEETSATETPETRAGETVVAPEADGEAPSGQAIEETAVPAKADATEPTPAKAAPEKAAEPIPKRRRGARKKKAAPAPAEEAAEAMAATAVQPVAEPELQTEAEPEARIETEPEAKPKRGRRPTTTKRAPRKKKSAAEAAADTALDEPAAPLVEGPGDAPAPRLDAPEPEALEPVAPEPVAAALAEAPHTNGENAQDAVDEPAAADDPGGPRRRGWWRRYGG